MIRSHCLPPGDLERFLERQKAGGVLRPQVDLDVFLKQILQKAYEFVPSESGSIILDDPLKKVADRRENSLVFIAAFGTGSENLVGQRLSSAQGIAGRVYQTGTPHLSQNVDDDLFFYPEIDEKLGFKTHSIVCVPIYIGKTVCGVLELINRSDGRVFDERDMTLLEIFAGYTSFTLQNALDAKRAHELAKRDDLTSLYNDRWFHVCLTDALVECEERRGSCAVVFMDLDNFKQVNDTYGHLAGSQVLREVGFLLKRIVNQEFSTVARYGGDEFVMVLPRLTVDEGVSLAATILKAIEETVFLAQDYGFGLTAVHLRGLLSASFGVSEYSSTDDATASLEEKKDAVLRRADRAMYRAKALGKGRIVIGHRAPEGERLEPVSGVSRLRASSE